MRLFRSQATVLAFSLLTAAAFLAFVSVPVAFCQVTTAAIHGTVTDPSGAVVAGANITVLNTVTGITTATTSDRSGYYIFTELQVGGPYQLSVTARGFETFVSTGLMLDANANREVDASLKIGRAAQTVEVTATAIQVETSNTQLEQVATSQQLESLPLEGRDPAGLQKLEPGVEESSDRFGSYSTNGNQTAQNSYILDGTDINDTPLQQEGLPVNPDALQEEVIVTSTMNPEFARNSGAVVNEVIRAGTNKLHGSGFEFYRDTFMNNGNYFSAPGTRPVFHQNLYGGTLGGPVFKNKLFYFLAYQGYRNRTATTTLQTTLTGTKSTTSPTEQFGGFFSSDTNFGMGFVPDDTPATITNTPSPSGTYPTGTYFCPASAVPAGSYSDSLSCNPTPFSVNGQAAGTPWIEAFNGAPAINIAPASWNSLASKLIQDYVPAANYVSGTQYNFNALNTGAEDQGVMRLDFTPSSRDNLWASSVFESNPTSNTLPFLGSSFPGFPMVGTNHFKIFSADWTHTFSPRMVNDLHGGYYRDNFGAVLPAASVQPSSYGFDITPELSESGLPYIGIGGLFNLGFSPDGPQPRIDTNLTYADDVTWVRGNHSLKFGASVEQFRVHNPFGADNNGDYGFNGGTEGGGEYSSGDPLMDFVLGIPDTYTQTSDGFIDALAYEYYAYAQDNWKVSPGLTLNFGIAWDTEEPEQNLQFGGLGIICWANSSTTSTVYPGGPPGLTYNGDPGCNVGGGPTTKYDHFGPRVGFAWSPTSGPSAIIGRQGTHDFVIRGGFGIYYNRDQEEQALQNLGDPPVFFESHGAADVGGSPSFANPFADVTGNASVSETDPYPYSPPAAGGAANWSIFNTLDLNAFAPNYNVPYVYNFNLNIQRALPGAMLMQIGYVGSIGHRLASWFEGDNITPAGHDACAASATVTLPTPAGSVSEACNGPLAAAIHLYFPQFTAQPAIVPGTGAGAIPTLPNGLPWYLSVANQNTEGSSNYNSLQASLIKSPTHGLQFTLGYTYSHALDNSSGYESGTGGDGGYGNGGRVYNFVPGFQFLNYGDSDFDARQRLVASYVYTVPVEGFLKKNLFFREALSGWGIGGLTAAQDGFPISISMGADRSLWCDGYSYFGCPDVPETSSFHIARFNPRASADNQYFDTSPFSPEPLGTFGNTRRNFFHGPGFNYTNLDLSKNFQLNSDGSRYMQWRLEAFNVFNHANFAPPGGSYANSPAYGQVFGDVTSVIVSADPNADPQPARAVQLVGKLYF